MMTVVCGVSIVLVSIFIIHCVCWAAGALLGGVGGVGGWLGGGGWVEKKLVSVSLTATIFRPLSCRLTVKYLNYSWGLGPNTLKRWVKADAAALAAAAAAARAAVVAHPMKPVEEPGARNVIVDRALARHRFSAKYLYACHMRRLQSKQDTFQTGAQRSQQFFSEAIAAFDDLPEHEHLLWASRARAHDLAQPSIKPQIITMLRADPTKSFDGVAAALDPPYWCSGETIRRLFEANGYSTYMERALPLMTRLQRKNAIAFSKRLRDNWGQRRARRKGKFLLINFDEKWFSGLREAHAKLCEALGLEKSHLYVKHTSWINKLMVICFTGYAFVDNMENGGEGVKIGMYRCWSARTAQRTVNETVYVDGQAKRPNVANGGTVKRERGSQYMVDCNVVGSSDGTSTNPKFSLLRLFSTPGSGIMDRVDALVRPGGLYEGYTPVFQGDRAPAHVEGRFLAYVRGVCEAKGWLWEPQASQMPISNTCDVLVFAALARRHATLCRERAGKAPASNDVIWEMVQKVWADMPSADIATAHVLVHRILKKVIDGGGGNHFINEADGMHCGISRDFLKTDRGLERRDGGVLDAPHRL